MWYLLIILPFVFLLVFVGVCASGDDSGRDYDGPGFYYMNGRSFESKVELIDNSLEDGPPSYCVIQPEQFYIIEGWALKEGSSNDAIYVLDEGGHRDIVRIYEIDWIAVHPSEGFY